MVHPNEQHDRRFIHICQCRHHKTTCEFTRDSARAVIPNCPNCGCDAIQSTSYDPSKDNPADDLREPYATALRDLT